MNYAASPWTGMGGVVLAALPGIPPLSAAPFAAEVLRAFPPEAGRQERFLALLPGLGIDTQRWADPADWAELVDQIPAPGQTFRASGQRCSDLVLKILEQETSPRKSMALRQQVLDAKRVLLEKDQPWKYTPAGAAYRDNQDAVLKAMRELITAKRLGRATVPALEEVLRAAKDKLAKQAESSGVNAALETLRKAGEGDIRGRFEAARVSLTDWKLLHHNRITCLVELSPDPYEWGSSPAWTDFIHASGGQGDPALSFQALRVNIHRPWLDEGLLEDRRWRLLPGFPFRSYSTGNPDEAEGAAMPMYITGFLVARNLRGTLDGKTLTSGSDPQIIGYFCKVVPPCPNPDPNAF